MQTTADLATGRSIRLNAPGGTFDPNPATAFIVNGTVSGAGGLIKTGGGVAILSGVNSYSGGTTVLAGTLRGGSPGGLVTNTAYTVNGGVLDLNSFNLTMSTFNGTGGVVQLGSAALTVNNAGPGTYSGVIQGGGSLIKNGPGTLSLSGNNSYIGGTTILAGTLQAGSAGGFVTNTAYTVNGGVLDLNSFNLTMSAFNGTGGVVQLGSAALTVNNSGPGAYSGVIQGGGSLIKNGPGTLSLSGNNSYTGGTTILAGTLQAGSSGGFVTDTAYTVNGGVLDLNSFNLTMSTFNGTGGVVQLGSAALTVNNSGPDAYSGGIQGGGSLIKNGPGTLSLSGNNSYTGGTTILAGTLLAGSAGGFVTNTAYTVNGGIFGSNSFNLTMSALNGTGGVSPARLGSTNGQQYRPERLCWQYSG